MKRYSDDPYLGHGGAVDSRTMSDQEMLAKHKMDWHVSLRKSMHYANLPSEVLQGKSATETFTSDWIGVCRDDTKRIFQYVRDKNYRPLQNPAMLAFFRKAAEEQGMYLDRIGTFDGGAQVWAQARLPGGSFTLPVNDVHHGRLLFINSHDGSMKWKACSFVERLVCTNGLRRTVKEVIFALKHARADSQAMIREAGEKLNIALIEMKHLREAAELLASRTAEKENIKRWLFHVVHGESFMDKVVKAQAAWQEARNTMDFLDAALAETEVQQAQKWLNTREITGKELGTVGMEILSAIVNSPGATAQSTKGTWYGALNGVTYYTDHVVGSRHGNGHVNLQSAFFGPKAQMKADALELALQYSEAQLRG